MAYTTIKKPSDYFNTVLYSGDNASDRAITGVGFQPDLVWIKNRNNTNSHHWVDSVRGLLRLSSQDTAAEQDVSSAFKSFDSDGFTVTEEVNFELNNSGKTYASWNWLGANGTSANTDGSISSTVSANTTSGFSIVSYTGTGSNATVGHGLGVTPKMMIVKQRTGTENWTVYHVSIGNPAQYMELNSTGAILTNSLVWNSTNPTSSVFSVGTNARTNNNTSTYIAYCFAEKQGFSKFGSYTGNGNADGTFVYTGFKPAFIMVKVTTTANSYDHWIIYDNKRIGYNVAGNRKIYADASDAEPGDTDLIDILSNGFKFRNTHSNANGSGQTYIYMAFAEEPLVGDNPATAR
jgi:hypothetical protein